MSVWLFFTLFFIVMIPYAMGVWGSWPIVLFVVLIVADSAVSAMRGERARKWEPSVGREVFLITLAVILFVITSIVFGRMP
jgi:hypothetical protein